MSRHDFDFYPTPPAAVRALGQWLENQVSREHLGGVWLDPCVGAGAIPLWLTPYLGGGSPSDPPCWDVRDIQDRMIEETNRRVGVRSSASGDSLAQQWRPMDAPVYVMGHNGDIASKAVAGVTLRRVAPYTGIVMNPPYGSDCERWILKAIQEARAGVAGTHRPKPYVFALTRVNFWADGQRVRLLAPDRLLWLEKRLSFTGDGKTDSSAHCWAVWNVRPSGPAVAGQTVVESVPLPPTSDSDAAVHREMLGHAKARQTSLCFTGSLTCDVASDDSENVGERVGL